MPSLISRMPVKTIAVGAIIATVGIAGTAGASSLITSSQIKDGAVMNRDIHRNTISENRLDRGVRAKLNKVTGQATVNGKDGSAGTNGANGNDGAAGTNGANGNDAVGEQGPKGDRGAKGDTGDAVMAGAYVSIAKYQHANAGAIATVACKDPSHTAISGGVRVLDSSLNTPVSSSFAGRMHWDTDGDGPDTNSVKDGRLDGWIVQFGGNAGATSDKDPEAIEVYATCVPSLHLDQHVTYDEAG